jgi:ABC-type molybdate transport system substrate-binding protein
MDSSCSSPTRRTRRHDGGARRPAARALHTGQPALLHAAGSLRGALSEIGEAFKAATGIAVQPADAPGCGLT